MAAGSGQKVLKDEDGLGDRVSVGLLARAFPRAAATPDNRGSRYRSGTRLGPRPQTSGTARQHEEHPAAQATPVKWIGHRPLSSDLARQLHRDSR